MDLHPQNHAPRLNLSRLNKDQREAVLHTEGPLLILAGAGSGKTNTMTHRIAYLITEKRVSPQNILGLSFTNKAANELKERVRSLVGKLLGPKATHGLVVSTFHSLCVRILREFAPRIGYTSQFSILDPSDQEGIVKEILKRVRIDEKKFDPSWILFQIGQAKNKFLVGDEALQFFDGLKGPKVSYDEYSIALQSVFPHYQDRLRALDAMDFDDLIFNTVLLLEKFQDVRETLSRRFRYIMVDEYQDTNPAQFRLMESLTCLHHNICVVGDDDQSIYAWRGADPTHILNFDKHFPGTKRIILNQNYRSTDVILNAANQVISKNPKRHPKELWSTKTEGAPIHMIAVEDDRAEGRFVVEEIIRRTEKEPYRNWKQFAILYRSNSQSRVFEEALRLHQIPYKMVGGLSFLDRKEIKDLLSYWKAILNPKEDAAVRRVINWPPRGIGKTSIEKAHQYSVQSGCSFAEALSHPDVQVELTEKAKKGAEQFLSLLNELQTSLKQLGSDPFQEPLLALREKVSLWAKDSIEKIGAKLALQNEEEDIVVAQRKLESISELAHALGMMDMAPYEARNQYVTGDMLLREYLSQLILDSKDQEEKEEDPNQVTLMTLHGSKGLEFPIVFLVGMEDGILPHQRSIDEGADLSEERRLFYVGITRAKDELFLTRAKNRIRYGKTIPRNPCRFLEDLPLENLIERDESSTPSFRSEEAKKKHEAEIADFFAEIGKRLKGHTPK